MSKIKHPAHYQTCNILAIPILKTLGIPDQHLGFECIDAIEYQDSIDAFPYGIFHIGNAIKYLWRMGDTHDIIEDLKKANWYIYRYQFEHTGKNFFEILGRLFKKKPIDKLIKASEQIVNLIATIEQERIRKQQLESEIFVKVDPLEDLQSNQSYMSWD